MFSYEVAYKWLERLSTVFSDKSEYLTELDSYIGDADHGINISRAFSAAFKDITTKKPENMSDLLKITAMSLLRYTGGASGTLYSTFFLKMAMHVGDEMDLEKFTPAITHAVNCMKQVGKSDVGDKTMLDVWCPVVDSFNESLMKEHDLLTAFECAVNTAEESAAAIANISAKKGKASYLGERSKGHRDPGAESSLIILQTALDVLRTKRV